MNIIVVILCFLFEAVSLGRAPIIINFKRSAGRHVVIVVIAVAVDIFFPTGG